MPSIAVLCEEMAAQRRWVYDSSKDGTKTRIQVQEDLGYGVATGEQALQNELRNTVEEERERAAAKSYFIRTLLLQVLLGNLVQIYLQGSFFSFSFDVVSWQVKIKVLASMAFSSFVALLRSKATTSDLGGIGFAVLFAVVLFTAWTITRVAGTFNCKDHMWNISTGCVSRS